MVKWVLNGEKSVFHFEFGVEEIFSVGGFLVWDVWGV